ncbi:JDVT-CTERM system glutamic-type intramembrane protease MrtJ [Lentisalinibacter orientalis]|uniref:JDVT-CTERM system glutamic-type intramembrane protease MrtJ n=1 Tax=Lentisalinibacter orientalis TaxID=2992241 RepID=UPI00386D899C
MHDAKPVPLFVRDPLFLLAVAAGPAGWLVLALILPAAADPTWPLAEPAKFIIVAALYPVVEEVVFRGLLQGSLLRTGWGTKRFGALTAANVLAAVAFAAAHLVRTSPPWAAAVLVPGLVFGFFRERHGLHAAIVLHVVYNAGFVWLYWG